MNSDSKYYDRYYDHVLGKKKTDGALGKVFDIIDDIRGRRGIKHEFNAIDADIQDELIETWVKIIEI